MRFDNFKYCCTCSDALQVKVLKSRKLYLIFTNPEFESEYYKVTIRPLQAYLKHYCVLLGIHQIIFLLVEIATVSTTVALEVKIILPLSAASLFVYSLLADSLDIHYMASSFLALFVAIIYGFSFVLSLYPPIHTQIYAQ